MTEKKLFPFTHLMEESIELSYEDAHHLPFPEHDLLIKRATSR